MYLPIMPVIQQIFGVSTVMTTLTFSMVLFVMAFGTLIYGSASDRYGRKPVLLVGLALFVAGSIICAVAPGFEVLIAGRLLQALAAGCGVVLARAIARDVYGPEKLAQVIAYITAAYVLGPTLAPPIGGGISDLFGWQSVFVFATVTSLVVIVLGSLVIRETHHNRRTGPRRGGSLLRDYGRLIRNREFVGYAFFPAFSSASFFALATYSSYLMQDHYQGTSGEYGLYFMILTITFMGGNFISGRIGTRVTSDYMVVFGGVLTLITIEILAIAVLFMPMEPLALFIPGGLMSIGQGLAMPHAQAAAINAESDLTGTASGTVMFLNFFAPASSSLFISALYDGSFMPLVVIVFVLSLMSLLSGIYGNLHHRRRIAAA
jgi:DHA1 family bicyclomycin/chloramphenicol resistance-like MFS transporter